MSNLSSHDKFHWQMDRRIIGINEAANLTNLRNELMDLGSQTLQREDIVRFRSVLENGLKTIRSLKNQDIEEPDGYIIFTCIKNALYSAACLLRFDHQLQLEDENDILRCQSEYASLKPSFDRYELSEDGHDEVADVKGENTQENHCRAELDYSASEGYLEQGEDMEEVGEEEFGRAQEEISKNA